MTIRIRKKISKDTINKNLINSPLTFIPNKGQVDPKAKYYFRGSSFGFYFTTESVLMTFIKNSFSDNHDAKNGLALALHFINSNPDVIIEGTCKTSGKVNYFRGKDQSKWITDLPLYEKIIYKDLWSGIDLVFYSKDNALKYDFMLKPGSSVEDIKLSYRGSNAISLDDKGNLQIHNDLGVLIDTKPISYQEIEGKRIMLESRFDIEKSKDDEDYFGFNILDNYNPNHSLVIDPGLVFSTFLGAVVQNASSNEDNKLGITVDKAGNVYVCGGSISPSFPVTLGAFQETFSSIDGSDTTGYVTKLKADGSGLIYSTFLGGSNSDESRGIAIDSMGNAYVTGETSSPDFPVTLGAFQEDFPSLSGSSAFLTKLNPDGSQLIYSTFLGGSDDDEGTAIDLDSKGNAYVTGETSSPDFPTTQGAFQESIPSRDDSVDPPDEDDTGQIQQSLDSSAFVTKLNFEGSDLVYSTFLGGSRDDEGLSIAVDDKGNAFVSGETTSPDFPVTLGAFQEEFPSPITGNDSGFVTKLNPDGSSLVYSTFLGGSDDDEANSIAIDKLGSAYVAGETTSIDFPVTSGAFQEEFRAFEVPGEAGFVTKLTPDGSGLIYSTYLSGFGSIDADSEVQGIAVDDMGNAYVAGFSANPDFPVTLGAFQEEFQGSRVGRNFADAFVAKLSPNGSILFYSTFLGGSENDFARDIAIDQEGNIYVIGYTTSSNFPITLGAFEENFTGMPGDNPFSSFFDTFVAKINPSPML